MIESEPPEAAPQATGFWSAMKSTLIGGIFFLLPIGLLLLAVSEVYDLAAKITAPIADLMPVEDVLGLAVNQVIAWGFIFLVCFLAGVAARHTFLAKYAARIDALVSKVIPGYSMTKTNVAGLLARQDADSHLLAVVCTIGNHRRHGFEVSRDEKSGDVTVFLPGTPNPNTGQVMIFRAKDVEPAALSAADLLHSFKFYGRLR